MPHTTPRLLASTTRRWPPICRQNLQCGEGGGRVQQVSPASSPPSAAFQGSCLTQLWSPVTDSTEDEGTGLASLGELTS